MSMSKFRAGISLLVSVVIFLAISAVPVLAHTMALVIKDWSVIPMDKLVSEARGARVVFLGEKHDVKEHHEVQLAFIKALKATGAHVVVGLEMFRADRQSTLDKWIKGDMSQKDFERAYSANWAESWDLYADIFNYSREQGIPMIGLNVSREITDKVAKNGFTSLSREELASLPPGLTCDVDKAYMDYIRKAYKAHGESGKPFVNFCEAQLMWDKVMAWHIVHYAEQNPGTTVVVLAGSKHAWKKGIPQQISKQSDLSYEVILPWTTDIRPDMLTPEYMDFLVN